MKFWNNFTDASKSENEKLKIICSTLTQISTSLDNCSKSLDESNKLILEQREMLTKTLDIMPTK